MKDFYKDYRPNKPPMPQSSSLQTPTGKFTPSPLERIFMEDLLKNPFNGSDQRGKRLGLIPRDMAKIQNDLVSKGVISPVIVDKRKLFELTDRGKESLQRLGYKTDSKDKNQGLEHRYFIEKIREVFIPKGWFPYKEKSDIDLVIEKGDKVIAVEIETGKNKPEQTKKNIGKLLKFKAGQKFILPTNETALVKTENLFSETNLPGQEAIQIIHVKDFLKIPPA